MAIVIKDIEMPKTCGECPMCVCYDQHEADCDNCCLTGDDIEYETFMHPDEHEQKKPNCPLEEFPYDFVEKYHELMKKYPDTKMFALLPFGEMEKK